MKSRLLVAIALLLGTACATTPSARFFALNATPAAARGATSGISLALGPIDLPEYLDRPQIVTRVGGNRLNVDEFNRWGGSLEEEISRVLALHLGQRLGAQRVYSYPSRVVAETDYRIALEIRAFDGTLGGEVTLDAAWSLIDDRSGSILQSGQAVFHQRAAGGDYDGYAAALSDTLAQLGDQLAGLLSATVGRAD